MSINGSTLLATAMGGVIAAAASLIPQYARYRRRLKSALRNVRDDFYAGQAKIAIAYIDRTWWDSSFELPQLATAEDISIIAGKVDAKAWNHVSGARRHYRQLEAQWKEEGRAVPSEPDLWTNYKLLEYTRRELSRYDRTQKFVHHSKFYEIQKRATGKEPPPAS